MEYEVAPSRQAIDTWRVEAIDYDTDGPIYVATFSGPKAHERALEYAAFKSSVSRLEALNH